MRARCAKAVFCQAMALLIELAPDLELDPTLELVSLMALAVVSGRIRCWLGPLGSPALGCLFGPGVALAAISLCFA